MTEPTDDQLRSLFLDPSLRWVRVRRGAGYRHVLVWRVLSLAEARLGNSPGLKHRLDSVVDQIGGQRLGMLDPWRVIPDLVRRFRGQLSPPKEDLYEIPESFFGAGQDEPRRPV